MITTASMIKEKLLKKVQEFEEKTNEQKQEKLKEEEYKEEIEVMRQQMKLLQEKLGVKDVII